MSEVAGVLPALSLVASIVQSSRDAIVGTTLDGTISLWSPAAEALFGYTETEAVGSGACMLVPADLVAELIDVVARVARREPVRDLATARLAKDGRRIRVSATFAPILGPGEAIVGICAVMSPRETPVHVDVRFQALVDGAPDAMVVSTDQGRIVLVNEHANRMFGYARGELIGELVELLMPESMRHGHVRQRAEFSGSRRVRAMGTGPELVARRKDGTQLPVEISLSRVATLDGTLFVSAIRDLTDRKREEDARTRLTLERAARAQAEQASRAKDEFITILSHELRTPLNAIMGWTQMLRQGWLDTQRSATALATIERNARTQHRLIEDLLDVSRLSATTALERCPVDIREIVDAVVTDNRPAAGAKGVFLVVDTGAPGEAVVYGDGGRLHQAVGNLVANAVKFTPSGGTVHVAVHGANAEISIAVTDTGEGISREFLPYAFERFRQEDSSPARRHGGLGLGLAIVGRIVEMHRGKVRATSPGRGRGACFTITLPAYTSQATARPHPDLLESIGNEPGSISPTP